MYHYLRMGGPPGQEVPTPDPHPDQKTLSSQDEETAGSGVVGPGTSECSIPKLLETTVHSSSCALQTARVRARS